MSDFLANSNAPKAGPAHNKASFRLLFCRHSSKLTTISGVAPKGVIDKAETPFQIRLAKLPESTVIEFFYKPANKVVSLKSAPFLPAPRGMQEMDYSQILTLIEHIISVSPKSRQSFFKNIQRLFRKKIILKNGFYKERTAFIKQTKPCIPL